MKGTSAKKKVTGGFTSIKSMQTQKFLNLKTNLYLLQPAYVSIRPSLPNSIETHVVVYIRLQPVNLLYILLKLFYVESPVLVTRWRKSFIKCIWSRPPSVHSSSLQSLCIESHYCLQMLSMTDY